MPSRDQLDSDGSEMTDVTEALSTQLSVVNLPAIQLLPQHAAPSLILLRRQIADDDVAFTALQEEPVERYVLTGSKSIAQPAGSLKNISQRLYSGDPRTIDVKYFALSAQCDQVKSGLVNFQSRTGRTLNAVGSAVIPGDISVVRSPGRSLATRAVTPGGGSAVPLGVPGGGIGGPIGTVARGFRCPTGYQFGGRFSNRQLANCGQQLFDTPGNGIDKGPVGRAAGRAVNLVRTLTDAVPGGRSRSLGVGFIGPGERGTLSATISRMAQVPRVGGGNDGRAAEAIAAGIRAVAGSDSGMVRLIRRDGVALDSRVGIAKLASQRGNSDMQDGTIISRIAGPTKIGNDEIGLFNSGIQSIRLVAPGGQEIRLDRTRKLNAADIRELNGAWGSIRRGLNNAEGTIALQQLADRSKGKLAYSETFNNIDKPNELVRIERNGIKKTVPRWVYEAYYAPNAPGRNEDDGAWDAVGTVVGQGDGKASPDIIADAAEAMKRFDAENDLANIPEALRNDALLKSKNSTVADIGAGRKLVTRKNGDRFIQSEKNDRAAFADKLYADLESAFGIATPETLLGKPGAKRSVFAATADRAVDGGKFASDAGLGDVSPAELAKIALSDFALGRSNRNPSSIALVADGNKIVPVSTGGGDSELFDGAKLSNQKLIAAISRKPEELLVSQAGSGWMRENFVEPRIAVRRIIIENYDKMIERMGEFDWQAYSARLSADGGLSIADKQHIEFMRRLLGVRTKQLRSSRKTVLRILGAGE